MRAMRATFTFAFLVIFTLFCNAQRNTVEPHLSQRTQPLYVFRILITDLLGGQGIDRTCVIVYPGAYFHLEHSHQSISEDHPRSYSVYEDRLTPDEIKLAIALLKDPELATYPDRAKPLGNSITVDPASRLISAEIPRSRYHTEVVIAPNLIRKAMPRPMKLLSNFIDALAERNPPPSTRSIPNNCRRPPAKPVEK